MTDILSLLAAARHQLRHSPAEISSSTNPKWRHLRELLDSARERRRSGQTVLEGWHLLDAWLATGRPVRQLVLPQRTLQQLGQGGRIIRPQVAAENAEVGERGSTRHSACRAGETAGIRESGTGQAAGKREPGRDLASGIRLAADAHWLVLDDRLFNELDLQPSPSPVLAVVDVPQPAWPGFVADAHAQEDANAHENAGARRDAHVREDANADEDAHVHEGPAGTVAATDGANATDLVILDRVQDPGNVGAIIRTAAAAGIRTLLTTPGTAACWAPKVLRAGMGGHFVLNLHENVSSEALQTLATHLSLAGTVLDDGQSLYTTDLRTPLAWVFGNEGEGITPALQSVLGVRLTIPQAPGVESLNVAASAAVCLFEQRRQRLAGHSGTP